MRARKSGFPRVLAQRRAPRARRWQVFTARPGRIRRGRVCLWGPRRACLGTVALSAPEPAHAWRARNPSQRLYIPSRRCGAAPAESAQTVINSGNVRR